MAAVLYTTTDAIRAALGLTVRDLKDAQIEDLRAALQLELDLAAWLPDHAAVRAAGQAPAATDEEVRRSATLELWCQYAGALLVANGLHMLAAQRISDGAMEMQRFPNEDLSQTRKHLQRLASRYKLQLTGGQSALSLFGVSAPSVDPVTGA